jgi:hypothetical protein
LNICFYVPLIWDLDHQRRKIPKMVRCHLHLGKKQLAPSVGPMVSNLNFCRHSPSLVPRQIPAFVQADAAIVVVAAARQNYDARDPAALQR